MLWIFIIWVLCAIELIISNFHYSKLITFCKFIIFNLLLILFAPIIIIANIIECISLFLIYGDKKFLEEENNYDDWDTK